MHWRQNVNYALLSCLIDLAGTAGAFFMALRMHYAIPFSLTEPSIVPFVIDPPAQVVAIVVLLWLCVSLSLALYEEQGNHRLRSELQRVAVAVLIMFLCLSGALYFTYRSVSRVFVGYFLAIDLAVLTGWRLLYGIVLRRFSGRLVRPQQILIVGANAVGRKIEEAVNHNSWAGMQVLGYVDNNPEDPTLPILGTLEQTFQIVREARVNEVIIALRFEQHLLLKQIVALLQAAPVQIHVVPDYFSFALCRATVTNFDGLPLINLRTSAIDSPQRMLKRAFDVMVSGTLLFGLLPLMAIIALAIRLESPGSIIFHQQRVGENGRLFTMYKFRSMVLDAEARRNEVISYDAGGNLIHKSKNDPRITRVGHIIRATSLDELPQIFNVLRGDMSMVGPRPELPWLVEKYESWQRKRFAVPQGLTGWWQVNGRADKPMHLNTEDDLYYVDHYSFLLDMWILWKTIPAVLKRHGAM